MSVVIFVLGIKSANGLVKSTINTANALSDRNIDVSIINIVGKNGGFDFLDPKFTLNSNIKKYSLDGLYSDKLSEDLKKTAIFHEEKQQFLKATYTQRHADNLKEINKRLGEKDLIIFSHPLAMVLYIKANPNSKVKKIIQVHGNYIEEVDNFNLLKEYINEVDYIQTVSKYMRDDMINLFNIPANKIICIYNITRPIKLQKKKEKYLKKISIIGSIQKRKNQLDAIKMLSLIEDRNVVLQIYGHALKKDYMDLLQEQIKLRNLTDRVIFMNVSSEQEIYENTDITIMTSEHEGFGYIFLESALYNIPIVAYDFKYGAKEFTRDNANGCLIEMGDYKSMAKKVSELLADDKKYNKVALENHQFFEAEYSEEKIITSYMSVFSNDTNRKFQLDDLIPTLSNNINYLKSAEMVIEELDVPSILIGDITEKQKFYIFTLKIKSEFINNTLYYQYKKVNFIIEDIVKEREKRTLNAMITSKNTYYTVHFKIPTKNRQSMGKDMENFTLYISDKKGNKNFLLEIINQKIRTLADKTNDISFKNYGTHKIKTVPHILNTNGLHIKYPSYESINIVVDENNDTIPYETKYLKFYGETLPFIFLKNNTFNKIQIITNSKKILQIDFSEFTYKSVFQRLENLELQYKLYDLQIDNIYFWELIRAVIFENILEATGVLGKHFTKNNLKVNSYIKGKKLSDIKNSEKLIFEFPRKKDMDYKTIAVQEHYKENSVVIEYPQEYGYSDKVHDLDSNNYPISEYLDFVKSRKYDIKFSGKESKLIKKIKKIFFDEFGLDIEFSLFIKGRLQKFKVEFDYFNNFFKTRKFSELLLPSSYWSSGIVSAAKKSNIIVSDIQYALISKYHPTFSFPIQNRAYGADRIYLWSQYWNIKEAPFNKSIVLSSNSFLYKQSTYKFSNVLEYDIAFVSQSRIGGLLLKLAYDYALLRPENKIIFCPHPDEDCTLSKYYDSFQSLPNVFISENETLLEIKKSKNVVGVYSTSLFEALSLNKNVYIAKINGYEVVEKEIKKGYFHLIENAQDLEKKLKTKNKNINFSELFYNDRS